MNSNRESQRMEIKLDITAEEKRELREKLTLAPK